MRAEHDSKKQFVERVNPSVIPSFEAVNALTGPSKTVARSTGVRRKEGGVTRESFCHREIHGSMFPCRKGAAGLGSIQML